MSFFIDVEEVVGVGEDATRLQALIAVSEITMAWQSMDQTVVAMKSGVTLTINLSYADFKNMIRSTGAMIAEHTRA
jgi:hypothetical protein